MEIKEITIQCLPSYYGLTLSFNVEGLFNKYYLYEKTEENYQLLMTSEDFQVTSHLIEEGKTYYVEAYTIINNNLVLTAKSKDTVCKPMIKKELKDSYTVSVAIPVYNAELFLPRCIDSILFSTLDDIEIILVDDESTDNSPKIMEWYQNRYPDRVKTFYQKNAGVSYARNKGIIAATGKYIGLMDDDDYVHPRMYEELYTSLKENNSKIAIAKTLIISDDGSGKICLNVPNPQNKKYKSYTYEEMIKEKCNHTHNNIFFVAIWNKIIESSLMKKHLCPPFNHYEDCAYTKMIYSYIDKFTFCFNAYYIWDKRRRLVTGSATTYNYKRTEDTYEYHKKYVRAYMYPIEEGNKEKMDYIVLDTLKEFYEYLSKRDCLKSDSVLYPIVQTVLLKDLSDYPLEKNKLLKENKELLDFFKEMLEGASNV